MDKAKIILWGGVGGFLFSALWGMVGGVSFFTLLIRALLGGGFFAFLLGASVWIVERFLPELLQPVEGVKEVGNQVDLVIPEHNPHVEGPEEIIEPQEESKEFEDFVEEVEEASKPLPSPNIDQPRTPSLIPSGMEEGVDDLPDLGGFADAFEGGASQEVFSEGAHPVKGADKGLDGGDPAVLAKAIQTLLKKDKEG